MGDDELEEKKEQTGLQEVNVEQNLTEERQLDDQQMMAGNIQETGEMQSHEQDGTVPMEQLVQEENQTAAAQIREQAGFMEQQGARLEQAAPVQQDPYANMSPRQKEKTLKREARHRAKRLKAMEKARQKAVKTTGFPDAVGDALPLMKKAKSAMKQWNGKANIEMREAASLDRFENYKLNLDVLKLGDDQPDGELPDIETMIRQKMELQTMQRLCELGSSSWEKISAEKRNEFYFKLDQKRLYSEYVDTLLSLHNIRVTSEGNISFVAGPENREAARKRLEILHQIMMSRQENEKLEFRTYPTDTDELDFEPDLIFSQQRESRSELERRFYKEHVSEKPLKEMTQEERKQLLDGLEQKRKESAVMDEEVKSLSPSEQLDWARHAIAEASPKRLSAEEFSYSNYLAEGAANILYFHSEMWGKMDLYRKILTDHPEFMLGELDGEIIAVETLHRYLEDCRKQVLFGSNTTSKTGNISDVIPKRHCRTALAMETDPNALPEDSLARMRVKQYVNYYKISPEAAFVKLMDQGYSHALETNFFEHQHIDLPDAAIANLPELLENSKKAVGEKNKILEQLITEELQPQWKEWNDIDGVQVPLEGQHLCIRADKRENDLPLDTQMGAIGKLLEYDTVDFLKKQREIAKNWSIYQEKQDPEIFKRIESMTESCRSTLSYCFVEAMADFLEKNLIQISAMHPLDIVKICGGGMVHAAVDCADLLPIFHALDDGKLIPDKQLNPLRELCKNVGIDDDPIELIKTLLNASISITDILKLKTEDDEGSGLTFEERAMEQIRRENLFQFQDETPQPEWLPDLPLFYRQYVQTIYPFGMNAKFSNKEVRNP